MKTQPALAAALLAAAVVLSMPTLGAPSRILCGGIGAESRARLAEEARGANLALELFVAPRGDYIAGAEVAVSRVDGKGPTLDANADGPLCYLTVPPGDYRVEARFNGITRSALATVAGHSRRPVRVALAFPEEAARGGLGPEPTPEEREEAKTP